MLPVENLTEAITFLPLYDLDSVLLASRQLSNIASKCVKGIRVWHFGYVLINVSGDYFRITANGDVDCLISGSDNFADVLEIALHNSCIKRLGIVLSPVDILPLPRSGAALEVGELNLHFHGVSSMNFLVNIVARFRKVQVINLYGCQYGTDFSPLIDLCRQKGIRSVLNMKDGTDLMAEE